MGGDGLQQPVKTMKNKFAPFLFGILVIVALGAVYQTQDGVFKNSLGVGGAPHASTAFDVTSTTLASRPWPSMTDLPPIVVPPVMLESPPLPEGGA